jgi:hypothetical protein
MPNFIQIDTKDEGTVVINTDLILIVDEIRAGHCRLDFGGARIFEVDGSAADNTVKQLLQGAIKSGAGEVTSPAFAKIEPVDLPGASIPKLPGWR